ncbi:MAG TPA: TRAP transporter small permease [Xanthobacteraceae bacterium]|nr:TRAP transporter small permease [Xanthobacteraceae bacterium]
MEAALDRLVAHSFTLARVSGWICGLLLTVSAFVIGLDIALRQIFVVTIGGANELAGYALAVSSSWGCTVALVHRIHVRIDSVYTHLSARLRALLDIVGLAAFIYFLAFVTFYAWKVLEQSIESNTHSISALEAPLAVPQAVWFAGFVVFLAVASVYLLRAMLAFAKGDLRRVRELLGARSVEEEMEFEKENLGLAPRGDR